MFKNDRLSEYIVHTNWHTYFRQEVVYGKTFLGHCGDSVEKSAETSNLRFFLWPIWRSPLIVPWINTIKYKLNALHIIDNHIVPSSCLIQMNYVAFAFYCHMKLLISHFVHTYFNMFVVWLTQVVAVISYPFLDKGLVLFDAFKIPLFLRGHW